MGIQQLGDVSRRQSLHQSVGTEFELKCQFRFQDRNNRKVLNFSSIFGRDSVGALWKGLGFEKDQPGKPTRRIDRLRPLNVANRVPSG
jgi:hypothetical protein